ncbi:MAG: hypothetical protein NZ516_04810 [Raineya sp.]|nr:hypothetical protein [Raineya sp.]
MKKVFSFLFVAVLLIGTVLDVQAQKKRKKKGDSENPGITTISPSSASNESLIIGKWKFDTEHFKQLLKKEVDKVRSTDPEKANEMESNIDMLATMLSSMTIEYKKGGEMETFAMGNSEIGSWRLEDGGKTLVQKGKEGSESKSKIIELSASKLVLETGEGDEKIQIQFIK